MRSALAMISATSSGSSTSPAYLVNGLSAAVASTDWWVRLSRSRRGTAPQIAIIGYCSVLAVTRPVAMFVVPGPEVTTVAPGTPVSRPIAAAMNAAFYSWRHTTSCGPPSARAS